MKKNKIGGAGATGLAGLTLLALTLTPAGAAVVPGAEQFTIDFEDYTLGQSIDGYGNHGPDVVFNTIGSVESAAVAVGAAKLEDLPGYQNQLAVFTPQDPSPDSPGLRLEFFAPISTLSFDYAYNDPSNSTVPGFYVTSRPASNLGRIYSNAPAYTDPRTGHQFGTVTDSFAEPIRSVTLTSFAPGRPVRLDNFIYTLAPNQRDNDPYASAYPGHDRRLLDPSHTQSTDWHAAERWSHGVPTARDDVLIGGNYYYGRTYGVVKISGNAEAKSLTIRDHYNVDQQNNASTFTVHGDVSVRDAGIYSLLGPDDDTATTRGVIEGNLYINGNATGGDAYSAGRVFVGSSRAGGTAELSVDGNMVLHPDGFLSVSGGAYSPTSVVKVGQSVRLGSGSTIDIRNFDGGGAITIGNATHPAGAGQLVVNLGGTLAGSGHIIGDVLVDGGTLDIGASPGLLEVDGDVTIQNTTTIFQIAGTDPDDYDRLTVSGDLDFSGLLEIELLDGFTPSPGDHFSLFDALSIDTSALELELPTLPGGAAWDTSTFRDTGSLKLRGSSTAVPQPVAALMGLVGLGLLSCRRKWRA